MGTFHDDLGELHGITVVVDTAGTRTYVGRCHEENAEHVVLHDADFHESTGNGGPSREEYLARAVRFGVFPNHRTLVIPRGEVTSIRRLGEMAQG